MASVDSFRLDCLRQMSQLSSFSDSWKAWKPKISQLLGSNPGPQDFYGLGEHLETIFKSNAVTGRSNSAVSTGGTAWECLVAWYLNLVFWGTDVVVIRPNRQTLPKTLKDAITVSISNYNTNTESDLIAFSVKSLPNNANVDLRQIDLILANAPLDVDVTVIQCKTNWNDNAQIPMLWDLIYSAKHFRLPQVSVGINGIDPQSFRRFAYSFITVPTSRGPFKHSAMAVLRVKNLSGGNYWGRPTTNGVAKSLNEFFTVNYSTFFSGGVLNSIQNNLLTNSSIVSKFLDLNF